MTGPCTFVDTRRTASASASDVIGKPASMMSTPSDDSCRAIFSFSSIRSEKPGACSPSRSVVSKIVSRFVVVIVGGTQYRCNLGSSLLSNLYLFDLNNARL